MIEGRDSLLFGDEDQLLAATYSEAGAVQQEVVFAHVRPRTGPGLAVILRQRAVIRMRELAVEDLRNPRFGVAQVRHNSASAQFGSRHTVPLRCRLTVIPA